MKGDKKYSLFENPIKRRAGWGTASLRISIAGAVIEFASGLINKICPIGPFVLLGGSGLALLGVLIGVVSIVEFGKDRRSVLGVVIGAVFAFPFCLNVRL